VFPGGRVDPEDADPELSPLLHGVTDERAREILTMENREESALAYWVAAARETFEETGILISRGPAPTSTDALEVARANLLAGRQSFLEILKELGLELDLGALQYHGYWLTPECEPRRYETRFFLTEVDPEVTVAPYEREMVAERWLTPREAIGRNQEGTLPLVLPTLFTLQELIPFRTPQEALEKLGSRPVPRRLPVPERAEGGIRFRIT
jgi:8-oxo-dGTP pyrophosphatase MutT (NUDIX family)